MRSSTRGHYHAVREGKYQSFNLTDYLDTGLFLNQRGTRAILGQFAAGRRFLNLFAYTGTATVAAAMGGVVVTTSADMSRTYLNRAARNLKRKGIEGKRHELVRAEALTWLRAKPGQRRPDFRRSAEFFPFKTHDLHARCAARSRPAHSCRGRVVGGGWPLIFSTHSLRFRLDAQGCPIFRSRTSLANCCQETSLAILPFVVSTCKDAPIDRRATREKL
jgi:23S rRNA (guanine2445-N2)-methyltransferase / 23S rRNA (guanine2069-N7)-methyltransferase